MKTFKLFSISMGFMLFFFSCSIEPYEGNELKATDLKTSNDDGCETGFAICADNISTCFLESGFNRWGWTIGPVSTSNHSFGIYAGAGQCNISNGLLAGTVKLEYDGVTGVAMVKFIAEEGYVFKETHLYIGNDPYPMKKQGKKEVPTVAPGQYPYRHGDLDNVTMDSYTVEGLSGDIYLIAHAVVCTEEANIPI